MAEPNAILYFDDVIKKSAQSHEKTFQKAPERCLILPAVTQDEQLCLFMAFYLFMI